LEGEGILVKNSGCKQLMAAFILAVIAFLQPLTARGQTAYYRNVSVAEFSRWLETKDFLLINVHVPYQGEIPGTDLLLPYHSIYRHKDRLPADRDAKIVVYCLTGPMGNVAAGKLVELGYTRVFHFAGGMRGWVRSGRELLYRNDR
jgi:rhodanese-related sulfurtransferase